MIDIGFLKAAADGIAALLFPDLEAVVHDARTGLVAHIANGFSKRKPGDPSLISDLPALQEGGDVIGPYEKGGPNNRKLRSITIVARSEQGEIVALLCLNFDVSALTQVQKLLSGFAVGAQSQARPDALFRSDWKERLNEMCAHERLRANGDHTGARAGEGGRIAQREKFHRPCWRIFRRLARDGLQLPQGRARRSRRNPRRQRTGERRAARARKGPVPTQVEVTMHCIAPMRSGRHTRLASEREDLFSHGINRPFGCYL
jgi:predicted transcriptional regulator YheO